MDIPSPPIPSITPWWPLIAFILGGIVPTLWAAWLSSRTRRFEADAKEAADKLEREAQQAIEKHKMEVERSKQEYDLRKDFQNDLIEECQKLRSECERLRDANSKLMGHLMEKDAVIKALTEENHELKKELGAMKSRLSTLEAHIASLEQTRKEQSGHQH